MVGVCDVRGWYRLVKVVVVVVVRRKESECRTKAFRRRDKDRRWKDGGKVCRDRRTRLGNKGERQGKPAARREEAVLGGESKSKRQDRELTLRHTHTHTPAATRRSDWRIVSQVQYSTQH